MLGGTAAIDPAFTISQVRRNPLAHSSNTSAAPYTRVSTTPSTRLPTATVFARTSSTWSAN